MMQFLPSGSFPSSRKRDIKQIYNNQKINVLITNCFQKENKWSIMRERNWAK